MPYTLELYFTGLCSFVPDEDAKECTVLLVNGSDPNTGFPDLTKKPNPHSPVLVVPLEYVVIDPKKYWTPKLVPDGTGKTMALFELEGQDLILEIGSTPNFAVNASPPDMYHPDSFLWTLDLDAYAASSGSKGLKSDALDFSRLPAYLTSRVRLKNGVLSTHKLAAGEQDRLLPFEPRSLDRTVEVPGSNAIADYSVLRIPDLSVPLVKITSSSKGTIALTSKNGRLTGTLTNQDLSAQVDDSKILDYLWYYKLLSFDSTPDYLKVLIPWADPKDGTTITPSTSSCPPTRVKNSIMIGSITTSSRSSSALSALDFGMLPAADRAIRANDVDDGEVVASSAPETFPDCVALIRDGIPEATAVVVHSRAVLTAGHVVSFAKTLAIRVGEDAFAAGAPTVQVTETIRPEGFLQEHDCADLALLILDSASTVALTPRQISSTSTSKGDEGTIVGFGKDITQGEPYGKKQRATMTVEEQPYSRPQMDVNCTETHEFRASRASGLASHGDSGAPFYGPDGELVGLAVRTIGSAKLEAVLLDLPKYRSWIATELANRGITL
jgi:hypothetical protein